MLLIADHHRIAIAVIKSSVYLFNFIEFMNEIVIKIRAIKEMAENIKMHTANEKRKQLLEFG